MYGDYIIAIKNNGSLWSWGNNFKGRLGDGTLIDKDNPTQIGSSFDWTSVSTGAYHTIATKRGGLMYSWGDNRGSQLGNGDTIMFIKEPQIVPTNNCVFPKPKTIESFNLFPNPSSGFITIKGEDIDNSDVLIYNLIGQLVKTTKLKNKTFDVSELASGAYLLYIRTTNQVLFAKKIIKI
jgi:alpha-tubulin suppressor-like RCC1 family protein